MPKVAQAAQENKIQGYNLPQGVISTLYRTCAAGQPGLFSKVGLHTYVDPRLGGGKVNTATKEDLVKLVEVEGKEWLFYKATPINVALIRATSADPHGNLSMEKECLTLDVLAQAMAAHNNGGVVIAQVERLVEAGSIRPKAVKVPGILVDCVVVAESPEMHRMNYGVMYDAGLAGRGARHRRQLAENGARTSARSSRAALHSSCRPTASSISASVRRTALPTSPTKRR